MKIVAIIAIRNESIYLERKIRHLHNQGVEVIIIDNDSTDDSVDICLKNGISDTNIYKLPFPGYFDLRAQLRKKMEIQQSINCDWIIHTDADEIIHPIDQNTTLKEAITDIDRKGYDVINCDEFVFVPAEISENFMGDDYVSKMKYYYFFEIHPLRLMRIYKKSIEISNIDSGGHFFPIEKIKLYHESFILRHYVGLSMSYIRNKYSERKYSQEELDMSWHVTRILDWENIIAPKKEDLLILSNEGFDKSNPKSQHFWSWP